MSIIDDIIDHSGLVPNFDKDLIIKAYVDFKDDFVEMIYPTTNSVWKKRLDCGSYSQHRWSYYGNKSEIQFVVKHNTCLTTSFPQNMCNKCRNKSWRASCITPSNLFYIISIGDAFECSQLLQPFVLQYLSGDTNDILAYKKKLPKPVLHVKETLKRKRNNIECLEKEIEHTVRMNNRRIREKFEEEQKLILSLRESEEKHLKNVQEYMKNPSSDVAFD